MSVLRVIGYVLFGIAFLYYWYIHIFAVMDGVSYALGDEWVMPIWISIFITMIPGVGSLGAVYGISIIIAVIPVVGSVVAVYGAVNVWDWTLLQAMILFFGFIPLAIILERCGYIR